MSPWTRVPGSRIAAGVALLAVALLAACSPDGSRGSAPPAPAIPSGPTSGSTSGSTVPAGWTAARQGDLVFALPPGSTERPAGAGMPGAASQWTKTDDPALQIPPAVAVFVETGRVGPLAVRTELIARARTAELGAEPVGPARPVRAPGSIGANSLEWVWDYAFLTDRPSVPSRQVEIVVQTSGQTQYGLLIGGPASYLTDELVNSFTDSVAIVAGQGAS